jgi:hypothetical protein
VPNPSEQLWWLLRSYDALAERLNGCASLEERKQLLLRMKILIDKIDGLIFSTLKEDKQDTSGSSPA